HVASQVSITPIPTDRPPFPLPSGVDPPAFFTIQPGAGYVYNRDGTGARVVYPNYRGDTAAPAGTRFNFWRYDPDEKGWHVYGLGTVTETGGQVMPDPQVEVYEFTGAMSGSPGLTAAATAAAGRPAAGADPVYLSTGTFVLTKTDLALPGVVPIALTR